VFFTTCHSKSQSLQQLNTFNMNFRSLFFAAFMMLLAAPSYAQKGTDGDTVEDPKPKKETASQRKKREKEEKSLKNKLWYGGSFNLNFGGQNGLSAFTIGVTPMIGYKIWGPISLGPRIGVNYTALKESGLKTANLFDFEAGIFSRVKIWGPIFAHLEAGNEWSQYRQSYDSSTQKWTKGTQERFNQYVGLGYNNGNGGSGYDVVILYNFADQDINTNRLPIDFRIGFTWKF
jgi:hypothetical protein